ncbi:membrane transporter, partial [Aureobasidium melanogenum]
MLKPTWLVRPWTQNFLSGIILFLTVGIYLALVGLGAGGGSPSAAHYNVITYTTLYAVFTVSGFFGGSIMNTLGPKWTMTLGVLGYPIFVGGLWFYDSHNSPGFALAGGIILGISAGFLWTVSGFIQFAYAEEKDKGSYIAWQLFLLGVGCTVGALIVFGITKDVTTISGVPESVYIAFIVIMTSAALCSAFGIVSPEDVVRPDGSSLAEFVATDFRSEFAGCANLLKDWRIVLLIIPMFATEMSSSLIPTISAYSFNLRTRSLNSVIFWGVQIPSTLAFGWVLDNDKFKRRMRGIMALSISCLIVILSWALAIAVQVKHDLIRGKPSPEWDWSDNEFVEFFFVIIFTGIAYAIDQMMVMWVISAFSNEPRLLARYGGFFKGMLSAGLCVAFGMEAGGVSYLGQTIFQTCLMAVSFPIMFFLVLKCVTDTNYFCEEGVIPPQHVIDEQKIQMEVVENVETAPAKTIG